MKINDKFPLPINFLSFKKIIRIREITIKVYNPYIKVTRSVYVRVYVCTEGSR